MSSFSLLSFLLLWITGVVQADNKYPIILVHGFGGWGREEFNGYKYWGGANGDLQEQLKQQGYQVMTATIGPFASNWDRACELYAAIKGGIVYYGANHAAQHKHNVTGRTYAQGLYPQWGDVIDGEIQKVHLIGHSMGGQTIRMLAQLLKHGTKGAPTPEDPTSHPLFQGGHDWIHSITTISTPNQGTTLGDGIAMLGDIAEYAFGAFFSIAGAFAKDNGTPGFFDAKLEHWGIGKRRPNESLKQYIHRVKQSGLFQGGVIDDCKYSLSTKGAQEENQWVTTLPTVFYYSFSTADTFSSRNWLLRRIHLPRPFSMFAPLQPVATFLGSRVTPEKFKFSEDWQINDGAVNTISMRSDGVAPVVEYSNISALGQWHHIGLFDRLDHEAVVGMKKGRNVVGIYSAHAALLRDLPVHEVSMRRLQEGRMEHAAPHHVVRRLRSAVDEVNAYGADKEIRDACANAEDDDAVDAQTKWLCEQYLRAMAENV